ncbi:hypothetical protein DAEQUDRAFT_137501 [Daedalea quercina L-15889]|uniref:S-adenosyl-L-methionine-dependent methyltransferase n=1 Tax=Daedalea quercina L-15889 TaxID=1314783 RepID=A0A165RSI2_9APHY|nr:hypothetical protein DAEQUDRAFT_137501 [Daedalea quercina L-15889]
MTILSAPSTHLPPIGKIQTYSAEDLTKAVHYLRLIYNPDVRGIRRVDLVSSLKHGSHPSPDPNLDALRSDAFERSYAIRWLTALIAQVYRLLECDCSDDDDASYDAAGETSELEVLLQQASTLLAICAGTASAGTITRTFHFHNSDEPIEIQLTDVPLENQDYTSVGAQTWGSACLLAEMLVEDPEVFGLGSPPEDLRVLELGAGTGLVSIALGKLLSAKGHSASSVVATDFHPSVLANLKSNIAANFPHTSPCPISISSHALDWAKFPALQERPAPFNEPFDLIFGADIIYEVEHARWIKSCAEKLLRKPDVSSTWVHSRARFHLIIPLRPTHTLESSTVETVFPFSARSSGAEQLVILSKDVTVCEASGDVRSRSGAAAEVEYVHYAIGWDS